MMSRTSGSRSFERSLAARGSGFSMLFVSPIRAFQPFAPQPVILRRTTEGRASKDERPDSRPSSFEAPPAQEAGVAPQDDGSRAALTRAPTYHTVAKVISGRAA